MTKSNYKDIFEQTRQLVNEWDPCSFIEAGAPKGEYDTLTYKILSGVINREVKSSLRDELINLLDNYYGTPIYNDLTAENQELLKNDINELIEKIEKLMPTMAKKT